MNPLVLVVLVAAVILGAYLIYRRHSNSQWERSHDALVEVMAAVVQQCPGCEHDDMVATDGLRRICQWVWAWPNVKVTFTSRHQYLVVAIGNNRLTFTRVDTSTAPDVMASLVENVRLPVREHPSDTDNDQFDSQPERRSA